MLDEVFGDENFVNEIVWKTRIRTADDSGVIMWHHSRQSFSCTAKTAESHMEQGTPGSKAEYYVEQFFDQYDEERTERYARINAYRSRRHEGTENRETLARYKAFRHRAGIGRQARTHGLDRSTKRAESLAQTRECPVLSDI